MRRILFLLLLAGPMFVSCKKDQEATLTGTYKGSFERKGIGSGFGVSEVTITFTDNSFSGQSNQQYYPALCNGTYTLNGTTANFKNECFWTANFDGRLILDGEFDIKIDGDSVVISRGYPGIVYYQDIYKLARLQ